MKELSLFTGAGGGLLATEAIGFDVICAVENNESRKNILISRMKDGTIRSSFEIHTNIITFNGFEWYGKCDIVTGGFPCQAFSTAARGRNNAINLWPEMLRVVKESFPKYVFAENVTKKAIENAAYDLSEVGYKTEMLSLSAADLGADHERERFWLLAYSDDKSELLCTINAKMEMCEEFQGGIWSSKPGNPGMANGMAGRVDRYEATGNGQVPIVAAAALWSLAAA